MNTTLDPESRKNLVNYRLDRAEETLQEADYNAKGGYYNTAVNRLYYAVFYAASAALLAKEIQCNSHAGVKSMFSLHFIKTGVFPVDYGKTINELFLNRQSGDYEDFIYCDLDLYTSLRPKAEEFIQGLKAFLKDP